MTDTADSYRSQPNRLKSYIDRIFEIAALAVIRASLLRSNADAVIETAIKKEIETDAKGIVPAVTRRLEDQIMDLSRDEIRKDVERRLGHQPLDVIIRNAINGLLDQQVGPLVESAVIEADRQLADRVDAAIAKRVDHHLGETIKHVIVKVIGPQKLKDDYMRVLREVAMEQAGLDAISSALNPPAETDRTTKHIQCKSILGMVQEHGGEKGSHIMMVGPAGSGKSLIAEDIAAEMKLPFYYNGPLQSEHKLTGYKDATGGYHATAFRKAFEHGGVYLFDEIDASSAQALVAFNTALANGLCDFPDRLVRQHANFVCLAAANTYGQGATTTYAGRERIDGATLDRFGMVEISYDNKLEYDRAQNDAWVDRVIRIREIASEAYPRLIVSMRASIQGARMLRRGYDRDQVEKMFIWRGQLTKAQINDVQRQANMVRS
jgi:cobaltochelatase CobS